MKDCIFCKIVAGKMSAHKVWEDEKHLAFLTPFPNTQGFTVVATKKHYPSYAFANDDKVLTDLVLATGKVALKIDRAFADVARTGMFFEGFGVDHLHSKLTPMHGTGDMRKWEPVGSRKKEFYKTYPGYICSHDGEKMDNDKLEKIAARIKTA